MQRVAVLGPVIALAVAAYAPGRLPFTWTHSLSEACAWHGRGSLTLLGRPEPDAGAERAQEACWVRRGLASRTPFVKIIVRKWPSEAELTAWRKDDGAHGGSLHAQEAVDGFPAGSGR